MNERERSRRRLDHGAEDASARVDPAAPAAVQEGELTRAIYESLCAWRQAAIELDRYG
jgi:hypothetical protein